MTVRVALAAVLLAGAGLLAACGGAAADPLRPSPPSFVDVQADDGPLLPVPPDTTHGLTERLHAALGDAPEFGGGEISRDRTRYTIRWHGEPSPVLRVIVDDYADAEFDVIIADTEFLPGDLRAEAGRLVGEHSPAVQGAGPRPAGDGVTVMLSSAAVEAAGGVEAALADNGIVSDYPLFTEVGDVAPV